MEKFSDPYVNGYSPSGMMGGNNVEQPDLNDVDDDGGNAVFAAMGDVSNDYSITQPQTPGLDMPEDMSNPGAMFNGQNQLQQQAPSTPQVASKWNKDSYRRILATDGDLYNRGINDRLEGEEMDEALANLSDDYRDGYEQGAFYNGDTGGLGDSAPPFGHVEMGEGSDKITRNPVANKIDGWYDRNSLLSLREHLTYDHGLRGTIASKSLDTLHNNDHYTNNSFHSHTDLGKPSFIERRVASEPFSLDKPNDVIEDDKNNQELDPTFYEDNTRNDNLTLEKDKSRGTNSAMPPTFDDYAQGFTNVGSRDVLTASKEVLADTSWFKGSSDSIWDRVELLQECINNLGRIASSDALEEGEYMHIASLLTEAREEHETLSKTASEYQDFDTQEYINSLPGGTMASNYASLERDGDLGPDDGSFLYREASKVREEVRSLDTEDYAKVSARMYVTDCEPALIKDAAAFREASLYFVYNDTAPIVDTVKRAKVIDDFMHEAEIVRKTALKASENHQDKIAKAASVHKEAYQESLEGLFDGTRSNWL